MRLRKAVAAMIVVSFGILASGAAMAKDILGTAADAGTFTILLAGIKATELTPLFTGKGPLTVFAPTDDAFAQLPKGVLESLFKPENHEKLKALIMEHLVIGKVTTRELLGKRLEAATANGGSLLIDATKGIMVDDAKVIKADVVADNGYIHVIDAVIFPK